MNFFNLPLETRISVYELILQEEHRFFHGEVPAFLRARLQITQEVYALCRVTATIKSEASSLYMNDIDDIKTRVDKFNLVKGNRGITIKLLPGLELYGGFGTKMERILLSKMGVEVLCTTSQDDKDHTLFKQFRSQVRLAPREQKKEFLRKTFKLFEVGDFKPRNAERLKAFILKELGMESYT